MTVVFYQNNQIELQEENEGRSFYHNNDAH